MRKARQEEGTLLQRRASGHYSDFQLEDTNSQACAVVGGSPGLLRPSKTRLTPRSICGATVVNKLVLEPHRLLTSPHGSLFKRGYSNPMSLGAKLGIVLRAGDKSKLEQFVAERPASRGKDLKDRLRQAIEQCNQATSTQAASVRLSSACKAQRPLGELRTSLGLNAQSQRSFGSIWKKRPPTPRITSKGHDQEMNLRKNQLSKTAEASAGIRAYIQPAFLGSRVSTCKSTHKASQTGDSFFPQRYPLRLKQDRQVVASKLGRSQSIDRLSQRSRSGPKLEKNSNFGGTSRISFLVDKSNNRDSSQGKQTSNMDTLQLGQSGWSKSQLMTNSSSGRLFGTRKN